MRSNIRLALERLTGFHIYKQPPRGSDIFADISRDLPTLRVRTVFDVGANVGQSAREYLRAFPEARIFCFEPVQSTFQTLAREVYGVSRVSVHCIALGAKDETTTMSLDGPSSMYRLASVATDRGWKVGATEEVSAKTLDTFCAENLITSIDFLKIDTEGAELKVLAGTKAMLSRAAVGLIQIEVGIGVGEAWHVPFGDIQRHMASLDYHVFSLTEQHPSFMPPQPYLARMDAVFISPSLAKQGLRGG